jgi:hypothetical protein
MKTRALILTILALALNAPSYGAVGVVGPVPVIVATTVPIVAATTLPISGTVTVNTPPPGATPIPYPTVAGTLVLKVDGSAITQPVSGTVAATQSGTWNIGAITTLPAIVLAAGQHIITDAGSVVNATLQASSAVIGHVIVDSGTIALSAGAATIGSIANTTFAVTQATGTNLHAVLDAGSAVIGHVITDSGSVTNATLQTGANVIGSISNTTFTVTQATGSNLHAVLDAGAAIIGKFGIDQTTPGTTNGVVINSGTTTVTQATGTNLHAVLDAGAAVIGHVINDASAAVIGAVTQSGTWTVQPGNTANTTPWLATISQGGNSASVSAGGALRTSPFIGTGGTSVQAIACNNSVAINISTATTTTLVAVSGATAIFVCGYDIEVVSGTTPTYKLVYGTGAACVTGQVALTGQYQDGAGSHATAGTGIGLLMQTPASQGLCLVTTGTTPNVQGRLTFGQW